MKISVIGPVLNEAPWIGYSIMSCLDKVHQFIYALDANSDDGTRELLQYIKDKYAHEKLMILETPNFHPSDQKAYNGAFSACIEKATGDSCYFLHPDMIVTKWNDIQDDAMAWWTNVTSFAGDFQTVITKGRCDKWKNIHRKDMGLHYFGAYGSQNEDFYHSDITQKSYKHFGTEFLNYPYEVTDSGIEVSHFCELKPYKRRLEKMKLCMETLYPKADKDWIEEKSLLHPRVTLEQSSDRFGQFEFTKKDIDVPEVIKRYQAEFKIFERMPVNV